MGPDGSILGERRHKDEVDSADDSDGGRADNEEVSSGAAQRCSAFTPAPNLQTCLARSQSHDL